MSSRTSTLVFAILLVIQLACVGQVSGIGSNASIQIAQGGGTPTAFDAGTGDGLPTSGGTATGGGSSAGGGATTAAGGQMNSGGGATAGGQANAGGGTVVVPQCGTPSTIREVEVCRRWVCDRKDLDEGTWTGSAEPTCNPGDIGIGRTNALKLLNLYRYVADLPPVVTTAQLDSMSQACGLMMYANGTITHTPPSNWKCYSALGAQGAGSSNICGGSAVQCIEMYMSDFGNEMTLGHRRWFVSNFLGQVGIGGTPRGSCTNVFAGGGTANKPWMSWPPQGFVPLESIHVPFYPSVDSTGWLFQSYGTGLSGATISVKDNGANAPITQYALQGGYGQSTAGIGFKPMGWRTQAGHIYEVTVKASDASVIASYEVKPLDCPPIP